MTGMTLMALNRGLAAINKDYFMNQVSRSTRLFTWFLDGQDYL